MMSTDHPPPLFFSPDWWGVVVERWNESDERKCASDMGTVVFYAEDLPNAPTVLNFGHEGWATLRSHPPEESECLACFAASSGNWQLLSEGVLSPVEAITRGRLQFEGDYHSLLQHLPSLTAFARTSSLLKS